MEKEETLVREDFSRPAGKLSPSKSSSKDMSSGMYMLYFKGSRGTPAGFGVAICDKEDNLLFHMKGPLHGSGITFLQAELMALKRGLREAVGLGINHISIFCDYQPVFELIMGRSTLTQGNSAFLMEQVQRIRKQLTSSFPVLVTSNQSTYLAYKLAMEVVSEVSIRRPPTQKKTCGICFDDGFEDDQMFYVALCGHRFCMECMKRYIEVALFGGSRVLRCPHYQCMSKLTPRSCANLLAPKLREMWEGRIAEESVPVADRVYCPNLKCSALMSETELSVPVADRVYCPNLKCSALMSETELSKSSKEDGSMRWCFKCGKPFCINCKVAWHRNLLCKDYKSLGPNPTENDLKLIALANQKRLRQCGKCKNMIELSKGCIKITCRCGYLFCYECGDEWKEGGCPHRVWCNAVACASGTVLVFLVFRLIVWIKK